MLHDKTQAAARNLFPEDYDIEEGDEEEGPESWWWFVVD